MQDSLKSTYIGAVLVMNTQPEGNSLVSTNNEANNETDNEKLFQQLYQQYYQQIYRYILSKNNNDCSIAEDLTQETFIKVYRNIDKVTLESSISNWLYIIANNICKDFWKSVKNSPLYKTASDIDNPAIKLPITEDNLSDDLANNEIKGKIEDIIKSLPDEHYNAIYLYEYEGYTYKEAAQIMGISESKYTSLLKRARERLKKIIVAKTLDVDAKLLGDKEYEILTKWFDFTEWPDDTAEQIKQVMIEHFDTKTNHYTSSFQISSHDLYFETIIEKHKLQKHHIVADFGMGSGILVNRISHYVKVVHGYDFSREMYQISMKKALADGNDNILFHNIDFMQITNPEPTYDYAYCINVLHHADNPAKMVKQIATLLKPGGSLMIIDFLKHEYENVVNEYSDLWYGFDKKQLVGFMNAAGLKKIWAKIDTNYPHIPTNSKKIINIPRLIVNGTK